MRILVTGGGGLLGAALQAGLPALGLSVVGLTREQLDITDRDRTRRIIHEHAPDVVINCAAYTRVDDAEVHEAEAVAINTEAARSLAHLCGEEGIRIVYPSTDYVFAGDRHIPYLPDDEPRPLNVYGRSKLGGEAGTRMARDHLVVRTSWLFGGGGPNFVRTIARRLQEGAAVRVVADQTGRPTYAHDLARAIGRLLVANAPAGTYHIANHGTATWFDLAQEIGALLDQRDAVTPCTSAEFPRPAQRPAWSVLDTTASDALIGRLRPWQEALAEAIQKGDY